MDIRKELGVNIILEKVKEMRLRTTHAENEKKTEVRAVVDMIVP